MTFKDIEKFQDSLIDMGIGGNDLALYVDFKPVYRYMTGYQDIWKNIPTNKDTMYKMFSMTKPITCVAAMQLFEKGKFLLNDALADYLPEFMHMKVRVGKDPAAICTADEPEYTLKDAEKKIEIQHLFSMSAGLDYNLKAEPVLELIRKTDGRFTTAEFIKAVAKSPLSYEPGTHWAYSLAHDVLGRLIEIWSGMSFGEYLKKNIFDPLEMETASFHPSKEMEGRYMIRCGFGTDGKTFVPGEQQNPYQVSPNMESGGAGLSMTVDDYAKFSCALANRGVGENGARILAGRTVDLMKENYLNPQQYRDIYASQIARQGYGYGLGVRTLVDRAQSGTASPAGEFGWGGAWGTYMLVDTDNKLAIVYAEQGVDTKGLYIQRRVRNLAYAALEWEGII
ncbi:MAG: beta-lactamase family protein [Lachnospiraceae bacterium]|nr:beta-lactamase family protein [Lachnospiraceae bacterium]